MQDLGHGLVSGRVSKARLRTDVTPELHAIEFDLVYGRIGGGNSGLERRSGGGDAENASAGGDDDVSDKPGTCVEDFHTGILRDTG